MKIKSKIFNYNFSKTWKGNMENMQNIIRHIRLFLQFNIIRKRVVHELSGG